MVVGGLARVYAMRTGLYAWRSGRWPKVTGTVIKSEVAEVPRSRFSNLYKPVVVYKYEIDSLEYCSDRMGFGFDDFFGDGLFRDRFAAEKVAARYAPAIRFRWPTIRETRAARC